MNKLPQADAALSTQSRATLPPLTNNCGLRRDLILALASRLSASSDAVTWARAFKGTIEGMLPHVDRVSINLNRNTRVESDSEQTETTSGIHAISAATQSKALIVTSRHVRDAEFFVDCCRHAGFPTHEYQSPLCLSYVGHRGAYVGSILLWRRLGIEALTLRDIEPLPALEPFITYLLYAAAQRFRGAHRQFAHAVCTVEELFDDADLTPREREVFLCRFHGKSAETTAEALGISVSTVRRHTRSIGLRLRRREVSTEEALGLPFPRRQTASD